MAGSNDDTDVIGHPGSQTKRPGFCSSCLGIALVVTIVVLALLMVIRNPKPEDHNRAIIVAVFTEGSEDIFGWIFQATENDIVGTVIGKIAGRIAGNQIADYWASFNAPDIAEYHNYILFSTTTLGGKQISNGFFGYVTVKPIEQWEDVMLVRLQQIFTEFTNSNWLKQIFPTFDPMTLSANPIISSPNPTPESQNTNSSEPDHHETTVPITTKLPSATQVPSTMSLPTPTNWIPQTSKPTSNCLLLYGQTVQVGDNTRAWTKPDVTNAQFSPISTGAILYILNGPDWGRIRTDRDVSGWWWEVSNQENGQSVGWIWEGRIKECNP